MISLSHRLSSYLLYLLSPGQVVNILREQNMPSEPGYRAQVTSHIRIPACYRAGISLFVRRSSPEWQTLQNAEDLPVISDCEEILDSSVAREITPCWKSTKKP